MSGILDGLAGVNSITAQIDALKSQSASAASSASGFSSTDPNQNLLTLHQSFDKILNSFLSASNNKPSNNFLSNIYSVEAQLNALKDQAANPDSANTNSVPADPKLALLNFQQNFNTILGNFLSPTNEEENNNEEENDPFAGWMNYQTSIANLSNPSSQSSSSSLANNLQYMTAQYSLNLDAAF